MTATSATDADSPPVQYFFDFVSGGSGGSDSSWQSSTTYCDLGLAGDTAYTYRVKARDSATSLNETVYSSSVAARTHACGTGHMDQDGDVDLRDFASWQRCFEMTPIGLSCKEGDFDSNGAIDLSYDYLRFRKVMTGP